MEVALQPYCDATSVFHLPVLSLIHWSPFYFMNAVSIESTLFKALESLWPR